VAPRMAPRLQEKGLNGKEKENENVK